MGTLHKQHAAPMTENTKKNRGLGDVHDIPFFSIAYRREGAQVVHSKEPVVVPSTSRRQLPKET